MSDEKKPVDGDVEPPESKRDWAEYPDRVKRQAANYYASGQYPNDEAIGRAVGAPAMLIRRWRDQNEPDGVRWNDLREVRESGKWALMPDEAAMSPAETASNIMRLQSILLSKCLEALQTGTLVDERGEPVPHLYDEKDGHKVPINTLARFKDIGEVGKITRLLVTIENLRDTAEERRLMESKLMAQATEAFSELFAAVGLTDAQKQRWKEKLQALQNQGRLPEGALLEVQFREGN